MSAHPVATVAGTPVRIDAVDVREALLRNGPRAAMLPASGTSEGRQLRRWLTQLIVTERVESDDVQVTLIKDGDHRLSRDSDLALLKDVVLRLLPV